MEQTVMGSYYASVERLYPQAGNGRLWGNDRRTKDDVGKAKLFERGTKCRLDLRRSLGSGFPSREETFRG